VKCKRSVIPVAKKALLKRINSRLRNRGQRLYRAWGQSRAFGPWFLIDVVERKAVRTGLELEGVGRECGALKGWERLAEEGEVAIQ
jgi:hypothetical protein